MLCSNLAAFLIAQAAHRSLCLHSKVKCWTL